MEKEKKPSKPGTENDNSHCKILFSVHSKCRKIREHAITILRLMESFFLEIIT